MSDETYVHKLENTLAKFLKPMKGVPFRVVVRALANQEIIQIDQQSADDGALIVALKKVIDECAAQVRRRPIKRPRPNEVGNDIEPFVRSALISVGFKVEQPRSKSGKAKATGYPDILFFDEKNRPCYLECKIYGNKSKETTFRSFYLSPSDEFKVAINARHLLLSFEMERHPIDGSDLSKFLPVGFKLVDLYDLDCDMKHEFNADNRRLYDKKLILLSGSC